MTDDQLDTLLRALGDATRRRLLDRLHDAPGLTLSALSEGFEQSRQAISKHLALLAAADLVVCAWRGREKLHYLNPVPLQALPARWVTHAGNEHAARWLRCDAAALLAQDHEHRVEVAALWPRQDVSPTTLDASDHEPTTGAPR